MAEALYTSKRIFLNSATPVTPGDPCEVFSGGLLISTIDGRVTRVLDSWGAVEAYLLESKRQELETGTRLERYDFGDLLMMPGLVDTHVHINEPGRTEWEGFRTATKAAAAGGFTTVADMPLNSIPPTTTVANLRTKLAAARGQLYVDVAFWGGIVPTNVDDDGGKASELHQLVAAGVIGFKCFLCPSGVDEFPHVSEEQVHRAAQLLEGTGAVLAGYFEGQFHAEMECTERQIPAAETRSPSGEPETRSSRQIDDPANYHTFLATRPELMEQQAIELVGQVAQDYKIRAHIVHLSAASALPVIRRARANGANLTVETCHHYLALSAEDVPDSGTEYKCCPPIRDSSNQQRLWRAVCDRDINLIVSDHSPSPPTLKLQLAEDDQRRGNFLEAWGGIASVQFGLPLFWTHCHRYGLGLADMVRLLGMEPAYLCGMSLRKGRLDPGYDGDLCVWDPDGLFTVTEELIEFQHKRTTPYLNRELRGIVHATFLRGTPVYRRDADPDRRFAGPPLGNILLRDPAETQQQQQQTCGDRMNKGSRAGLPPSLYPGPRG
ncbi:allantoinase-like isoform X3 [Anopheles darlingi]|uniref:allantoinase-like isoform X1 n=2 Tax=Anopheles darlingi TaxID=43151 RepID=UPI0021000A8F|nr:allantoinase-like isoform X1 [Anopheles darlingi]XP_049534535.1 allantoinase-like isoform X2 [Anopheles darlingi]XP_049534544.1 allantoinase-like isoform X3 [Anopheles darlingi]